MEVYNKGLYGVGEMVQWLRPLVLVEDPGSVPSNYTVAHNQLQL